MFWKHKKSFYKSLQTHVRNWFHLKVLKVDEESSWQKESPSLHVHTIFECNDIFVCIPKGAQPGMQTRLGLAYNRAIHNKTFLLKVESLAWVTWPTRKDVRILAAFRIDCVNQLILFVKDMYLFFPTTNGAEGSLVQGRTNFVWIGSCWTRFNWVVFGLILESYPRPKFVAAK